MYNDLSPALHSAVHCNGCIEHTHRVAPGARLRRKVGRATEQLLCMHQWVDKIGRTKSNAGRVRYRRQLKAGARPMTSIMAELVFIVFTVRVWLAYLRHVHHPIQLVYRSDEATRISTMEFCHCLSRLRWLRISRRSDISSTTNRIPLHNASLSSDNRVISGLLRATV